MRERTVTACGIGAVAGLLCWCFSFYSPLTGGDFGWAMVAARELVAGRDPYNLIAAYDRVPYPLPAAILALPFAWFSAAIGAALFFGISSGLLAFALTRENWTRLGVFASFPFWSSLLLVQWSPLAMASVFFPAIGMIAVKPQAGLPAAVASHRLTSYLSAAFLFFISLVLYPHWPARWWSQIGGYQYFSPVLFGPGTLILMSFVWWRNPAAQLLLSMAISPQRWFYDAFLLWLIPRSKREIFVTAGISWIAFVLWYRLPEVRYREVWMLSVCCNYLPMLAVIALRRDKSLRTEVPFRN